uniref:Rubisco LSMT substrate-binding domain-containing protein n=1 Tax=Setaria italica TaxID=4555 RepID=K3XQ78_SETIT
MPFWLRTRSLSSTQLMAAPARARLVRGVASRLGGGRRLLARSAASKPQATSLKDDSCTAFLHWLQRKAGTQISSMFWDLNELHMVIADRNYAVGEQVMIRYGKYSNAVLALNFGFTLSRNIYDQHLGIASDPESRSVHPFRKEMAKDLLVGELRVLRSARAWVATYCETLSTS